MINIHDILETVEMIKEQNLDIRTVTMGISLFDCISDDKDRLKVKIFDKITRSAKNLVSVCEELEKMYGIPIVNKRISVTPISYIGAGLSPSDFVELAEVLESAAKELGVNFIGGFSAHVQKGAILGAQNLIEAIPEAMARTTRICSSINVATTKAGINMDAVKRMGEIIKETALLTAEPTACPTENITDTALARAFSMALVIPPFTAISSSFDKFFIIFSFLFLIASFRVCPSIEESYKK